jgi:hypothetical protein
MRKVGGWLCLVLGAAVLMAGAADAAPKSIFDDDWVPPKAVAAPPADPPSTKPPAQDPIAKPTVPDPAVRVKPTPVVPAVVARRAVPGKPEQVAVRKVMKEIYAGQIADHSATARRKFAQTLLAQADKSATTPTDQFVLLAGAIDAAVESADLPLAFGAVDRMGGAFDVDAAALKTETVLRLNARSAPAESAAGDVAAGLELREGDAVRDARRRPPGALGQPDDGQSPGPLQGGPPERQRHPGEERFRDGVARRREAVHAEDRFFKPE